LIVLENNGFTFAGKMFDTMIAAHVIDSQHASLKMDYLSLEYLHHRCIPITDLIGSGRNQTTMNTVPTDTVAVYAAEDADVTLRLANAMEKILDEMALRNLFENLEMPLMPILTEMERNGITVDPARLKAMQSEFSMKADVLRDRIIRLAGVNFNLESPKQLAEILFVKMGYPAIKKTRTGMSTDSEVLEQLASEHDCEIAALLLEYRKLTKLISTYLVSLVDCINPRTGRVHTSFHQASVITGRLSSSDPNLQNIPVHDEGRQIRSAFIAKHGCKLISADYSQVELRMLAHFCGDETLCRAFADDLDIHRIVASEVFGVDVDDVTPAMRSRAKTVNFGIIYGQTGFGLARTLGIGRTEASEFIRKYKQRFPKIEVFMAECVEQARNKGYVETISGRRRRIPDIDSRNQQKRNLAERTAINTVVQGSAADLIKQAMINLDRTLEKQNSPAKMLLQIHDELIFETPAESAESTAKVIAHEMSTAIKLNVPLKVDCNIGDNWLEAK
ncbi:MAG TPA: DNA polymerase I, partial [Phycisphaerae bacterium]|nr:DNA polymerase I [Phycisphaerae bacterium]